MTVIFMYFVFLSSYNVLYIVHFMCNLLYLSKGMSCLYNQIQSFILIKRGRIHVTCRLKVIFLKFGACSLYFCTWRGDSLKHYIELMFINYKTCMQKEASLLNVSTKVSLLNSITV